MKKILLFTGLLFLVTNLFSQEKLAEIKFTETIIDYGIIENGEDGNRTFVFKNTGNSPLVFTRIFSSCGCTIPKKPEKPVMPGESGEIQVSYDTKRTGIFQKAITVKSNAKTANIILRIKGEVLPEPEEDESSEDK
ncbi:DUF1573 domain-containing protein [Flavobacteriaceae bacterium]|nr:DUF1573 domain-containing protein [Flavobacteriaceae bacterium]MDB9853156.1 DUF1573 domain-containing protein [Flavobacteriaceae bacterium]MDB9994806.1 DUF1573 domain-containing protein [Flavobacteriaceae bacterium]